MKDLSIVNVIAYDLNTISLQKSLSILTQVFTDKSLIELPITMGNNKNLTNYVRSSQIDDVNKWKSGISEGKSRLTVIYTNHNRRLNFIFYVAIFCSFAAVALLFWIVLKQDRSTESINLIMPLIPSFLSGTLFWIYRLETKKIEIIEHDIQKLEILGEKLKLLAAFDDHEQIIKYLKQLE